MTTPCSTQPPKPLSLNPDRHSETQSESWYEYPVGQILLQRLDSDEKYSPNWQFLLTSHDPLTAFNKYPVLQAVQVETFPEHSAQVASHCWHDPSMLVHPVGQTETH